MLPTPTYHNGQLYWCYESGLVKLQWYVGLNSKVTRILWRREGEDWKG